MIDCKRLIALLVLCALMLGPCLPAGAESKTVYAGVDGAKVYNAGGEVIGTVQAGTKLKLTGVKGDICRVKRDGRTAYMMKSELTDKKPGGDESTESRRVTVYVAVDGAKVYDKKGKVIGHAPLNTKLTCTAVKDGVCKVTADGKTAYMKKSDLSTEKSEAQKSEEAVRTAERTADSGAGKVHGTAREMDWWTSGIQRIFARGTTAVITDVETGLSWREQRRGGTNHADVQPLTAADTAVLKRVYGGTWSWKRRAIFVTIDGVNYAASMNGMPHGGGSITDNDFDGHHCIHFTNSRTHGSNTVCSLHQAAIREALKARL